MALSREDARRLLEAERSIEALEATLRQGQNRFGTYGDNCRSAIRRWKEIIADIKGRDNE